MRWWKKNTISPSISLNESEAGAFVDILMAERFPVWRQHMINELTKRRINLDISINIKVDVSTDGLALLMFLRGVEYGEKHKND